MKYLTLLLVFVFVSCQPEESTNTGLITSNGMVVSAHPIASQVGLEILKNGGNAVDAAIAVQFALTVVHPSAGNIGGGGFMVYRAANGDVRTLDFREAAPGRATRNMYIGENDMVMEGMSTRGHLASGVPGAVDGMVKAHEQLGTMPWESLVDPSVKLAAKDISLQKRKQADLIAIKKTL